MKRNSDKPRRGVFWKLTLFGVLIIVTANASALMVHLLAGDPPPWRDIPRRMTQHLAREFGENPADHAALQEHLDELHQIIPQSIAVFAADGTRLAAAGDHAPAKLDKEGAHPFQPGSDQSAWFMLERRPHFPRRFAEGLVLMFLVVAGLSIPFARSMARPLERLTGTARKLGSGDLSVRSNMDRKDEVGMLARTLDEMASRLEHRIRGEKELLANISHEIRTPLSRIKVALELSEEEEGAADVKKHLAGISADVGELEQLLEDVFTITRLDLGKGNGTTGLVPKKATVNPAMLIQDAEERFATAHPGHKLECKLPAKMPEIQVDPKLVRRVVDNLLQNAAKYSDPGNEIALAARSDGKHVFIEVSDRGIGVEEADLPLLFEPFFRTDRSRTRKAGGTGLGLTLCRRIVEAHGGSIEAESRQGGGLTVRFTLSLV